MCHRFLNAVEPGTEVPIHKHPTKDETFVILRGKVRVTTHRDDGRIRGRFLDPLYRNQKPSPNPTSLAPLELAFAA